MYYIISQDKLVTTHSQIRSAMPNASLSDVLTDELLARIGVPRVVETAAPDHNPVLQDATPISAALVDDQWQLQWQLTDKYTTAEEEAAALAEAEEQQQLELFTACEDAISALIQSKITAYNLANKLALGSVHSCANYAMVEGYTHQPFCAAVWAWNVAVWEAARGALDDVVAGTVTISDPADLLALMPAFSWEE